MNKISLHHIQTIVRKELLTLSRDKGAIFSMLFPIILYPLMFIMILQISAYFASDTTKPVNIGMSFEPDSILSSLWEQDTPSYKGIYMLPDDDTMVSSLASGDIQAYIRERSDSSGKTYDIYINSTSERSSDISSNLQELLGDYIQALQHDALSNYGLDPTVILDSISYSILDTADNISRSNNKMKDFLSIAIFVGIICGACYPALSMLTSEKDQGTLETLYSLPISEGDFALGKYISALICGIMSSCLNLASLVISSSLIYLSPEMASALSVHLSTGSTILMIITCLLIAAITSQLGMCIALWSKGYQEGQNYMSFLVMILMFIGLASAIPTISFDNITRFIPVVNMSLFLSELVTGSYSTMDAFVVMATNLILTSILTVFLIKNIHMEHMLFNHSSGPDILIKASVRGSAYPSFADAILLYFVGYLIMTYFGGFLQLKLGVTGLVLSQFLLLLIPVIYAIYIQANLRKTFRIMKPKVLEIPAALLMWFGTFILVNLLASLLVGVIPNSAETIEYLEDLTTSMSLPVGILVIGIIPAVCEEIMFRGFILSGLIKKGKPGPAIILSATLFGLMHFSPIRLIPTMLLGILLGYIAYKSGSLLLPMMIHAINNSISVILEQDVSGSLRKPMEYLIPDPASASPLHLATLVVVSIVLVWLGLILFMNRTSSLRTRRN